METREECQAQLKPFVEALEGLQKNGFQGIAKIQAIEWPLTGTNAMEIILELRKEIRPAPDSTVTVKGVLTDEQMRALPPELYEKYQEWKRLGKELHLL